MENTVIHNRDIIMFGLQPWDTEIGSNFKNMAIEMAKHNRILYVNRPLDRLTRWKKRSDKIIRTRLKSINGAVNPLQKLNDNHWILNPATMLESINWLPKGNIYNFLNKLNNKKLAEEIKKAVTNLDFRDPLLIIDNDFFNGLYLKEYLKIKCMVYYIRDYLLSQPYFLKHGTISEPALMAKADLVVANSTYLSNYSKKYNENSYYIGQGCTVDNFIEQPSSFPEDIMGIKKPVLGYCGYLTTMRLDIELLSTIAKSRPEWNIVLVGPEDEAFKRSGLHEMKNVYFLGSKPEKALPAYVHYFDVCLNPQLINQMTIGNYPRKVDEYLAAGKPVVATTTEAMQVFADCTYLCSNAKEYITAIEEALKSASNVNAKAYRVSVAKSHTWEASIAELYSAINHVQTIQYATNR